MGLTTAQSMQVFEEFLFQALNGINLENVVVSVDQKEVTRNTVVLKENATFSLLWQVIDFSFIGPCF